MAKILTKHPRLQTLITELETSENPEQLLHDTMQVLWAK